MKPENDTECFLRWYPAWECCRYLVFRVFLGPSKTNNGMQFHASVFLRSSEERGETNTM